MSRSLTNIKSLFPLLQERPELVYLDSASTSHKPKLVIDAITSFYSSENANVHRGLYELSSSATHRYEQVRSKVKDLIGAQLEKEVAFTKGSTESINIVANSFEGILNEGDNIVISEMEHHANLIPWQQVCKKRKAMLRVLPINSNGDVVLEQLSKLLDKRTKLLAITHISNVLGTVNPVREIVEMAHVKSTPVLLDAAQSVGHMPVNVKDLDVDFLVFSAHKMFGSMGTGILYAKEKYHNMVQPLNFGGGAIREVSFDETTFMNYPSSLEAGTPNVSGVIGLGAAIDFVQQINLEEASAHTKQLASVLREKLLMLPFVKAVGNPIINSGIVPFVVDGIHAHDVAGFLVEHQIAVRAGHHCTQPLHKKFGLPATVRASFSIYNTEADVDKLVYSLKGLKKFWS
jgi:cysteine desulfurase / selenocysteine lyase